MALAMRLLIPVVAYLLGSLDFGIISSKLFFRKDIREHGSCNPGTTNTFRVFGKAAGWFVLILDVLKGVAAVLLARGLMHEHGLTGVHFWGSVAGFCATLGHMFPVFFGFKGGKGVATTGGVMLALQPIGALIVLVPFLLLLITTKYMSLSAMICVSLLPFASLIPNKGAITPVFWLGLALAVLVIFAHRNNIQRLRAHTERKLFQKQKQEELHSE